MVVKSKDINDISQNAALLKHIGGEENTEADGNDNEEKEDSEVIL